MDVYRFDDAERESMERSRVPFAVYQFIDKRVVTVILSAGFCDLFGYTDKFLAYSDMDHDMYKDTHPDDAARIADDAVRFATDDSPDARYDVLYRTLDKDRVNYMIIHALGEHVFAPTGERLAYIWYTYEGMYNASPETKGGILTDHLNNVLREESFRKDAHYDSLTGLPSMAYFFELALAGRNAMTAEGKNPVMLFTDLCRMKYYNHKNGFAKGDELLRSYGRLLAKFFGNENCCRLDKDHFAVYTEEDELEKKLDVLFAEVRDLNNGMSLPVHVGIYKNSVETVGAATACDRAKLACDSLWNIYSSTYCSYDASMLDAEEKRQYIVANLDKAIHEGWIKVCFQPIVRSANGRVCDEEVLARWDDPVFGLMMPSEFIPVLESSGLVYKLDLYVVGLVIDKLKKQEAAHLHLVPQSINLSRSDFDCCDIVDEVRRRVDESGFSRSLFTIEITESAIGRDTELMSVQIDRFRELGFAVWMDDFGNGYSSLDTLTSVHFDLVKFDMRFLQHFDESEKGKIMLTELIKMATSLGIDTICEGVETSAQVRFLRETGCSKLQGFYYIKPISLEKILERYKKGEQIGFEDPRETDYYDRIGRINLHDLEVLTRDSRDEFSNFFNVLPMAVVELTTEGNVKVARSNQSCRDFIERYFGYKMTDMEIDFYTNKIQSASSTFADIIRRCSGNDDKVFVDIKMNDGATAHIFLRRMANNPVTGTVAVAVVVLSIHASDNELTYSSIARALAADYYILYYVDLETEEFIEYSSAAGKEDLAVERHGSNFFAMSAKEAERHIYQEDLDHFLKTFTKEKVVSAFAVQGVFALTFRIMQEGEPVYVVMKAMRMDDQGRNIIIGISNVDAQMKQKERLDRIERDRIVYSRLMALSGDFIAMYTVDPMTSEYVEYSVASIYEGLGFAKSGDDFFHAALVDGERVVLRDDFPRYRDLVTKNNMLRTIRRSGVFSIQYHLMLNNEPKLVALRAALVREGDGDKLIVGVEKLVE